ncbi:MAG: hypothetical protein ACREPQ_18315 [Rhodanobacter sp.]
MTLRAYTRLELAENQLRAAVGLFVSGGDRFSVITLAGAADVLLSRLVINTGQENFTESTWRRELKRGEGVANREAFGKGINDTLRINQLKHMDSEEDAYVDLDPDECAMAAILKAIANLAQLGGRERDYVVAFMAWVKLNLDPAKYNVDCDPDWMPPAGA